MAAQLRRFVQAGGRIDHVVADFHGANGQPGLIRFYSPAPGQPGPHASYGTLAHELGHALACPEQWRAPAQFDDAHAYARARELGEAHAWLNQHRLCRAKQGGLPEPAPVLPIENDHDFGTQAVDIFAHIDQRLAAGWTEAQLLDELALLNANMFPCGMGAGNHKTYGQCNRWDWLQATAAHQPALAAFVQRLGRPPNAADQKLITKFNLFTPATSGAAAHGAAPHQAALAALADALAARPARPSAQGSPDPHDPDARYTPPEWQALQDLYALGRAWLPDCTLGVACAAPAAAAVAVAVAAPPAPPPRPATAPG
jgi:hypothetical protein